MTTLTASLSRTTRPEQVGLRHSSALPRGCASPGYSVVADDAIFAWGKQNEGDPPGT